MNTQEQLSALESRQLELLAVMRESDAHALKCQKLGRSFASEYPEDFAAYNAANAEYNENEGRVEELKAALAAEAAAIAEVREEVEGE